MPRRASVLPFACLALLGGCDSFVGVAHPVSAPSLRLYVMAPDGWTQERVLDANGSPDRVEVAGDTTIWTYLADQDPNRVIGRIRFVQGASVASQRNP